MAVYKNDWGNTSWGRGGMFFMVMIHLLEAKFLIVVIYNSWKCTHCNQTNHIIDQYWEWHDKPSWPHRAAYLSNTVRSSITHDSNTLDIFANEYVTLSKFDYDSLIQNMHLVSTSDMATLADPGISYLASSSLSSWLIDSGASTHITDRSQSSSLFTQILLPLL